MEDKGEDQNHGGRDCSNNNNNNSEFEHENPILESTLATSDSDSRVQSEILKAVEVVERDSLAIAHTFVSLFTSLRLALSQVTGSSVDHMECLCDATGRLQESVLEATTKGNRYINSCLRLNEEMKSINGLASQLKILRRNVDALDSAVNKLLHSPQI